MKSIFYKIALIFLVLSVSLYSCSSNSSDNLPMDTTQIEENVQNSTWRITKFIDSDNDETNHYTGFNFTFEDNGILTTTNGTNTYQGNWSITDSNSNDDSLNDLDFNIFFSVPSDFEELSDDWDFISQTSSKIELIDISGGNGGTDYLTFEKN